MRRMSRHSAGCVRTGFLLAPFLLAALLPIVGCGGEDAAITVSPTEHDFGRVMQGETREHTFTLSNHGNRTTAAQFEQLTEEMKALQTENEKLATLNETMRNRLEEIQQMTTADVAIEKKKHQ